MAQELLKQTCILLLTKAFSSLGGEVENEVSFVGGQKRDSDASTR